MRKLVEGPATCEGLAKGRDVTVAFNVSEYFASRGGGAKVTHLMNSVPS